MCYLEHTSIEHPQCPQLVKYRNEGVSPNTKISKCAFQNYTKEEAKRTNLKIDFYLAFSKSSREKEAFRQNLLKTEEICMV